MKFPNNKIFWVFALGILLVLVGFRLGKISSPQTEKEKISFSIPSNEPTKVLQNPEKESAFKVTKVIDGDTINVNINGKIETLRLIGIDTPEIVDPRKPVQCFAVEASNKAKAVLNGKSVRLEADNTQGERDKYNRLLRYVFLEDKTNFNQFMIAQGYAHEYTYQSNPYKYQTEFREAEKEAREQKRGLWADDACLVQSSEPQKNVQGSQIQSTGNYICDCSKLCSQITTCDEAYFQLNNCGCSKRDSDSDGVPCESLCK